MLRYITIFCLIFLQMQNIAIADDNLPRFVSLRATEANTRTGPGLRYPIKWVLVRPGTPLEILREYEQWRYIRDIQGDEGWVHSTMLSGKRTGIIKDKTRILYETREMNDGFGVVKLEKGVIVDIDDCKGNICKVKANELYEGWIPSIEIWGVYEGEEI